MNRVFISGSISIKQLPIMVKDSIKKIIDNNMEILVGDADGIDTKVQNYCKSLGYYNVLVYSIYSQPRYKADGFKSKHIIVSSKSKKERERQQEKDAAMTIESDYSLIIWDGSSKGSYKNIFRAIDNNKKIKLYLQSIEKFLESKKINKNEIEDIYRKNNGYTASEIIEYLKSIGENYFPQTRSFNKSLLDNKIITKENGIYKPMSGYENLFFIDKFRGKVRGVKFTNEFINWIEKWLKEIKEPEQETMF